MCDQKSTLVKDIGNIVDRAVHQDGSGKNMHASGVREPLSIAQQPRRSKKRTSDHKSLSPLICKRLHTLGRSTATHMSSTESSRHQQNVSKAL